MGVIGLGLMGTPISSLLLKAGYAVNGYDIAEKRISNLVHLGLRPSKTPKEVSKRSDLVILSLPNWNAVRAVVEGNDGILASKKRGQLVLDTSTSPPHESKKLAERLRQFGIEWMDVPISGSSAQAKTGNMVFMVGGRRKNFDIVKPILDRIGKKTVYVGGNGEAATLKLVVNHTLLLNEAAAIEGMVLGIRAGLDPQIMYEVLCSGAASSDLIIARGKDMLKDNFTPKGSVLIGVKDLTLSLELAKKLGVVLPMGALYLQFLLKAHYNGSDKQDATVVLKDYKKMAGM